MHFNRLSSAATAAALTLSLGACVSMGSSSTAGGAVSPAVAGIRWAAALQPDGGSSVHGTATVMPGGNSMQTSASVFVSGSTASAVHPWHIHRGTCSNDMGIVGSADSYPRLGVSGDGSARITVGLPFATPTSGDYFVSVHRSAEDMSRIACGNLTMGMR